MLRGASWSNVPTTAKRLCRKRAAAGLQCCRILAAATHGLHRYGRPFRNSAMYEYIATTTNTIIAGDINADTKHT